MEILSSAKQEAQFLQGVSDSLLARLNAEGRQAYWKLLQANAPSTAVQEFVDTYLKEIDNED